MLIQTTKTIHQGPIKMVIYGESGAGKTSLVKTISMPSLVISAESGLLSLQGTNIDYINIAADAEGNAATKEKRYAALGEIFNYLKTEEAQKKYKVVFIDSITEIADVVLDINKSKFTDKGDGFKMWGAIGEQLISLIKAFRDLPHYHVIFTCLEDLDKDESGKRYYAPSLPGNVAKSFIVPALDEVLRLCFIDGKRVLVTQGTGSMKAKDRSGKLNPIEEPNLDVVFNKIKGSV